MSLHPREGGLRRLPARVLLTLAFLGLTLSLPAVAQDYTAIFGRKYHEAEEFLRHNPWIGESLHLPPAETRIAEAVVFPEILRFRILEDEIQVRGLKVLYVQLGPKYANFSVGHFQMKPIFAEQLERDYNRLFSAAEKAAAGIASFDLDDSSHVRNGRVLRLDDVRGQAQYLRLFMMVMDKHFGGLSFADDVARVRFYATAYNCGYAQGETAIRRMMGARLFHVQLRFPKTRYNYADVAAFFFSHRTAPVVGLPRDARGTETQEKRRGEHPVCPEAIVFDQPRRGG